MGRYSIAAREGLDLYAPEDRHEAYRAMGIKVIAYPDGSLELTGDALGEMRNDSVRSNPIETGQTPRHRASLVAIYTNASLLAQSIS